MVGMHLSGNRKVLMPRTLSPDLYRRAIAEDRKMTEAVANSEMTRAQRQARVQQLLEEMLEEIDRIEEANRAKLQIDRLKMEDATRHEAAVAHSACPLSHRSTGSSVIDTP
jgi:hypothetical protein